MWHLFSGDEEPAGSEPETADTEDTQPSAQPKPGGKPSTAPDRKEVKPEGKKTTATKKPTDKSAAGDPWNLGPIDPESPAAGYYEAFNLLKQPEVDENYARLLELLDKVEAEGWTEEYPELVKLLEDNREALRKLKEVIDSGGGSFPIPEDEDMAVKINHLQPARFIGQLLALETMWFQKEGDIENAARNIADGLSFCRDLSRGGTLVADLVGVAIQGDYLDIAVREISRANPDTRFCSAIERSFYDLEYSRGDASESLKTDAMLARNQLQGYIKADTDMPDSVLKALEITREDATPEAFRQTIEVCDQWVAEISSALEQGYYPAIKRAGEICARIESGASDIPKLVNLITPQYANVLKVKAHSEVRFEMARAGIALQNYANEKGVYPDSLDALVPRYIPRVPVDPFSGKPIKYTHSEKGWTLRSFGPDMDDDKGAREAEKFTDDGDLILQKK